jgi:cellulose synthase/poly-beta-1,6-N-acetylglucosamine synthase-like glycosyltransferase
MTSIFWSLIAVVVYTYVLYPALVTLLAWCRPRPVAKGRYEPTVSIIVAAYNEEAHIEANLLNKLSLDYPMEKLEIIVVSDGSTDRTDAIVSRYVGSRVQLLRQQRRSGKTAALNRAVEHAKGEILVVADANSMYAPDALRHLTSNFHDPTVGYVTGRLVYANPAGTLIGSGCTLYMKYEDALRHAETNLGSIVGVNGGIDAIRRRLYRPMAPDDLPDFILPLRVTAGGMRVVYERHALLYEHALTTARAEYRMRVRVVLRAWWTLAEMRRLLDVRRYGLFSVQLFSHKVLRYLVFAPMLALYVMATALSPVGAIYRCVFLLQTIFSILCAAGYIADRAGRAGGLVALPYYFVLVNVAAGHALVRFLLRRKQTIWTPRLG